MDNNQYGVFIIKNSNERDNSHVFWGDERNIVFSDLKQQKDPEDHSDRVTSRAMRVVL